MASNGRGTAGRPHTASIIPSRTTAKPGASWPTSPTWRTPCRSVCRPCARLDLSFDLGLESADNIEVTQSIATSRLSGAAAWRVTGSSTIGVGYATTTTADDPRTGERRITDFRTEFSQRIRLLPRSATRSPLQVFLRYARQTATEVPEGQSPQAGGTWTLSSGVSMSVF